MLLPAARNRISVATICGVEVASAIARRRLGLSISPAEAAHAMGEFRRDFTVGFDLIEIDFPLVTDAIGLAERYALRGYDAVQLAAAISTDAAARALGSTATLV